MSEGVRKRNQANAQERTVRPSETSRSSTNDEIELQPITTLDIIRLLFGLLLLNFLLSYFITGDSFIWGYQLWWLRPRVIMNMFSEPIVLTDAQLALYDGSDESRPIYLGLNGTIYDVSSARHTYGPGGSYNVFAGRDAARAFVSGCFQEDSNPDLRGVEWTFVPRDVVREGGTAEEQAYREEMLVKAHEKVRETIESWARMFRGESGKDYYKVGRIERSRDWLKDVPLKTLCESAEKMRPRTDSQRKPGFAVPSGK